VIGEERPTFLSGCLLDMFLAIACLDQRENNGLDLDTPFIDLVPELARTAPDAEAITVRHLLTRTSGLQDPRTIREMREFVSWENLCERVREAQRLFSPGSVFNYGGVDRIVMMILLGRVAGMPIGRLIRKITVDRANIYIRPIQYGPPEADGFRPLETFDTATLLDVIAPLAREGGDSALFSEELRALLQVQRLPLSRSLKVQPWPHAPIAFTNGLFKYSDGLVGFNGWQANQSCGVRYDPAGAVSFVVALEGSPIVRDVIIARIAEALGYDSVQSRATPCTIGGFNGLGVDSVIGEYAGWADGYRAKVSLDGDMLACELDYRGEKFRRVRARVEDDAWLVADSALQTSPLEFFRDKNGRICLAQGFLPYAMSAAA
jgi:hypothetical protein